MTPTELVDEATYTSRLLFLYHAVNDTQNTIRFIDTKAAFCVTLLSGMVAASFQRITPRHPHLHPAALSFFICGVGLSLIINLRVIFPIIKPHSASLPEHGRPLPKFFIHQSRGHHWIRHTFSNSVDHVLVDDHNSYLATICAASDADLLVSMSDELLLVSLIRQIKQDRLYTALCALILTIVLFLGVMLS